LRQEIPVVIPIHDHRHPELPEVIETNRALASVARSGQRRRNQAPKQRTGQDDKRQFD
jgi:hypothetical protein